MVFPGKHHGIIEPGHRIVLGAVAFPCRQDDLCGIQITYQVRIKPNPIPEEQVCQAQVPWNGHGFPVLVQEAVQFHADRIDQPEGFSSADHVLVQDQFFFFREGFSRFGNHRCVKPFQRF